MTSLMRRAGGRAPQYPFHQTNVGIVEAISKILPERGSRLQSKSAHKFRGCEPAFPLDLNLFEEQPARTAGDHDTATSSALNDTDPPGYPMHRQRIVYF